MTTPRRAARVRAALCGLVLSVLLLPLAAAGAHAADTSDDDGNLSVVVTDDQTGAPSPSTSAPGAGGGQGSGSGGSGSGGSGSGGGEVPAGSGGAGEGEVSVGGMLYLGGLSSSAALSANPGEGDLTLWFTVRNASNSTIDATADFWMNNVFGGRVDTAEQVAITALLPGESRVVTAQLHHAGQWTLLDVHVTFTPPESVDGTPLTPVTRDASVLFFPWLIIGGLGLLVIGFFVVRALRATTLAPVIADAA